MKYNVSLVLAIALIVYLIIRSIFPAFYPYYFHLIPMMLFIVFSLRSGLYQGPLQREGEGALLGRSESRGADATAGRTSGPPEYSRRCWNRGQHRGRSRGYHRQWTLGHPGQRRAGEAQERAYGELVPSITVPWEPTPLLEALTRGQYYPTCPILICTLINGGCTAIMLPTECPAEN